MSAFPALPNCVSLGQSFLQWWKWSEFEFKGQKWFHVLAARSSYRVQRNGQVIFFAQYLPLGVSEVLWMSVSDIRMLLFQNICKLAYHSHQQRAHNEEILLT